MTHERNLSRTRGTQLGLNEQRPLDHEVWRAVPAESRTEVTQLLATMIQQHAQDAEDSSDD
jgi:hypothetical protein